MGTGILSSHSCEWQLLSCLHLEKNVAHVEHALELLARGGDGGVESLLGLGRKGADGDGDCGLRNLVGVLMLVALVVKLVLPW